MTKFPVILFYKKFGSMEKSPYYCNVIKELITMRIKDTDIKDMGEYVEVTVPRLIGTDTLFLDKEDVNLILDNYLEIRKGYCRIRYNGKLVFLHNAILKRDTSNPKIVCDHINRNKLDNRKSNLRIVSQLTNCHNIIAKGYTFHKKSNSYRAYLNINGKHIISKNLATKEEAIKLREQYLSNLSAL